MAGNASKLHPDLLRTILNKLVLTPRLKRVARECGISPPTLFSYLSRSQNGEPEFVIEWLGVVRPFHEHTQIARKLSIVALDHSARDQAINGWREFLYHDGLPVWRRDPVVVADAVALCDEDWELIYGKRKRSDVFERDPLNGGFIHDYKDHPPNPALLVKLLSSLAPDIYGEKSELTINHTGHVWIEGSTPQIKQSAPGDQNFNEAFALTEAPSAQKRPANTLAIPAPCKTSEEFDKRFLKKLVREVVVFRDEHGEVQPPFPDDIIVRDSWQDKAFTEAGIAHETVTADELRAQGYCNDFLYPNGDAPKADEQPPTSATPVDPLAAAYAALDSMPDGSMKDDLRANLDKIKAGQTTSRPPTLEAIPKSHTADDDVPDDRPQELKRVVFARAARPPIGVPGSRGIAAGRPGDGEYVGPGKPAPGGFPVR